jgi:hypothetical protein
VPASRPLEERFWEKVNKNGPILVKRLGKCWVWTASIDGGGYGLIGLGPGKKVGKSGRVAWELQFGPIPEGMCVLHKCDNPCCVRGSHLFLGTQKDNAVDRELKGRSNHPAGDQHRARLHPELLKRGGDHHMRKNPELRYWGEKNCKAILTEELVRNIRREFHPKTMEYGYLAGKYGVTASTIGRIVRRETWPHVN